MGAAALWLLPTSASSAASAIAPSSQPLASEQLDCSADAQPVSGNYVVHNNQWGRSGITGAYRQCVGISPSTAGGNTVSARWTWNWPAGPNEIKGFPGIGYGAKPGHPAPASTLPLRVDALQSATTRWSTRSQVTGRGQRTYDLWLTRDGKAYPCFDCAPITHEIMIALEPYGGYGLDRNPAWARGEVKLGGESWKLYSVDGFGSVGWRFIVLQSMKPRPSGALDLREVMQRLRERKLITGTEYLTSVELGSEPVEGTGDVLLEHFSVDIQ